MHSTRPITAGYGDRETFPAHVRADAPPRLTASTSNPGMYNGKPRISIDGSPQGTEVRTAVYTDRRLNEAQVTLMLGGSWSVSIYSNPEQLREFAALLNETADRLQDCATNGIGASQ